MAVDFATIAGELAAADLAMKTHMEAHRLFFDHIIHGRWVEAAEQQRISIAALEASMDAFLCGSTALAVLKGNGRG